jgi:ankyrin repeat protein
MVFWRADLGLRLIGVAESKKALQWRIKHMLNRPIPKSSKLGALGIIVIFTIAAALLPMAKAEKPNEDNNPVATENEANPTKSLHQAAKDGDLEQVKSLIDKGADINAKDEKGQTPLHFAARHGYREVAKLLIAQGADVNASMTDAPWTPLLDAACTGQTQVVKLLLQHGAKVDAGDALGYTPLVYALWSKDEEGIKALISAGADINKRPSENDCPPLFYAVWEGYKRGVRILIDAGANVNAEADNGWTPLRYAIEVTMPDMINLFLGTGVKIPDFHKAALEGNLAKVKEFVESGMDVDTKDRLGWTPSYWALSAGQKEVFEYLLGKGAEITTKTNHGRTLLHQASQAGFAEIVKSLIAKGVEVDAKSDSGNTPLKIASGAGHKEIVKLLIANGAVVNVTAKNGTHPLGDAARSGHEEVVKLLLASGAKVNLQPEDKLMCGTALHAAARGGHIAIFDLLIANGADVNAVYKNGTPLHLAARPRGSVEDKTSAEIVEKLLAHGAKINAKSPQQGRTPLHEAAGRGRYKSAERLIAAGADVSVTDKKGHTPLWYAKDKDHTDIVELLRKHGAK